MTTQPADAYEIQLLQVARWVAAGARVKGHKVGLTSVAMQRQMSVDQPDYGHLLDRMFWPEHEPIPVSASCSRGWSPRPRSCWPGHCADRA